MRPTQLPPPGASDVLYLIDLSGYVFRAYHAIAPLTSLSGEPTQATYGTVSMLSKLVNERQPSYLGVAMDTPGRTFRDDLDARYKAHRPTPPPDLGVQMKRCREIVDAYRIPVFVAEGLEADDLIAVAAARARQAGLTVVIVSSDKDLMQIVDDKTMLWDTMRDKVYGPPEVEEKLGVPPGQVRDLLALVGDTSDNVPGVPSVGPKTASDLLKTYGTLEGIYEHVAEIKKPKLREALETHEAEARLSQKLVTLRADAPVDLDLEALRYGGADSARLREIFVELGFVRFIKAMPSAQKVASSYRAIRERSELDQLVERARAAGRLSVAVVGTSPEPMRAAIAGIALAVEAGEGFYVPVGHRYLGAPAQLRLADVLDALRPVLADPGVAKVGHDTKYTEVVLMRSGVELAGVEFDTMLASYVLDPETNHELAISAERDAGVEIPTLESIAPKRKGKIQDQVDEIEIEEATPFAAAIPETVLGLRDVYVPRLKEAGVDGLLSDLEMPLSRVLARMEHVGVLVDAPTLSSLAEQMGKDLLELEQRARDAAGVPDLNVGSPRQLETVLFDDLGLKTTKRTKTARSTDAEALEAIADDHPLPAIVLEHRAIAKLKSTYIDALPRLVHPDTGRIHTRWSQAVAATGRLSSSDPNLQNIPIRTALGREIRRAFVAPAGSVILSADYSQIELRVLAHLSRDPDLLEAFQTGQDVHARTAMGIFDVPLEGVTDEMRRQSKTVNFGVIYGMGEVALGKRLGIPRAKAASFIEAYFRRYRGVHEFMERTMAEARKTERVVTMLGRRRLLPDLRSTDRVRRAYAERIAQNTPIQGTAADLLKLAMVKLAEPVVPGARMVLTVHDELTFEVPETRVDEAAAAIKQAMEGVARLEVPLVVDLGWGRTWADAH